MTLWSVFINPVTYFFTHVADTGDTQKGMDCITMCEDLSLLSCYVRREGYQPPMPAEVVEDIDAEEAKHFTVLDVN